MNAANEPPVEPVDPARAESSSGGLAASTLRALRAGTRTEPAPDAPTTASEDVNNANLEDPDDIVEAATSDDATPEPAPAPAPKIVSDSDSAADATGSRPSVITTACALVAVGALVFAIVAGALWWHAGHNSQRSIGIAREQIDDDARLAIVTVNTSDYHHPSAALDNWLDASTGSLHAQFSQSRTTAVKLLAEAEMVTKASVLDAAVTNLDLKKGTATVIASVNVTRTPATGSVSTVRNRFRASMTRSGGQWKLSNLAVVPVSLS